MSLPAPSCQSRKGDRMGAPREHPESTAIPFSRPWPSRPKSVSKIQFSKGAASQSQRSGFIHVVLHIDGDAMCLYAAFDVGIAAVISDFPGACAFEMLIWRLIISMSKHPWSGERSARVKSFKLFTAFPLKFSSETSEHALNILDKKHVFFCLDLML